MKICFIDDCFSVNGNKARVDQIDLLNGEDDLVVHQVLPSEIRDWADANPVEMDLIFVDYKLQEDRNANGIFYVGSEIVSLVRTLCPDTPIYLLSVTILQNEEYERAEGFERKVGENYLSKTKLVYLDIKSHASLKSVISERNIDKLLDDLLQIPTEIKGDLKNSLPGSVRKYFSIVPKSPLNHQKVNVGPRVEFYRWFIDFFYKYPGFLLNEDACALYLGLTVDCFRSISRRFDEALYAGIFSNTLEPRWWKSKVEDLIIAWDDNNLLSVGSFSEACAKVLNISPEEVATCAYCGEVAPEELALTEDTTDSTLIMVHTRCSHLDEDFNIGPYFQKPRIVETK